jgi:NAD(P)H dehydrogenase (quinone)
MKTLIVYGHPHHQGHHGYFLEQLLLILDNKKIDYDVLDLYALKFDPVLTTEELSKQDGSVINSEIKEFRQKISETDKLIFIFPTWWQGAPAIVKGFFDRVFSAGFAFKYENGLPKGLLKGKKAAVFSATGGPRIISKLIIGDKSLKVTVNNTLRFCGMRAKGFSIGSARALDDNKKRLILNQVTKMISYLYK